MALGRDLASSEGFALSACITVLIMERILPPWAFRSEIWVPGMNSLGFEPGSVTQSLCWDRSKGILSCGKLLLLNFCRKLPFPNVEVKFLTHQKTVGYCEGFGDLGIRLKGVNTIRSVKKHSQTSPESFLLALALPETRCATPPGSISPSVKRRICLGS